MRKLSKLLILLIFIPFSAAVAIYGVCGSGRKFELAKTMPTRQAAAGSILMGCVGVILTGIVLLALYATYRAFISALSRAGEKVPPPSPIKEKKTRQAKSAGILERLALWTLVVLIAALCWTGFGQYIFLSNSEIYLRMIQAHRQIGSAGVGVLIIYLMITSARRFRPRTALLIVLYPIVFIWMLLAPTPLLMSLIFMNGIVFPVCLFLLASADTTEDNRPALAASALIAYCLVFVILTGFFPTLNPIALRFSFYHRIFHSWLAPCAAVPALYFYLARRRAPNADAAFWKKSRATAVLLLIPSIAAGALLHTSKESRLENIRAGKRFYTQKFIDKLSDENIKFKHLPEGVMETDRFCGNCHPITYRQWARSMHANAVRNKPFQKTVKALMDKHGAEFIRLCASCHDPEAALSADPSRIVNPAYIKRSQGISCRSCHYMNVTGAGNAYYSIDLPRSDFISDAPLPGAAKDYRDRVAYNIQGMTPRQDYILNSVLEHVGDVSRPAIRDGLICFPCHALESVRNGHVKIPIDNVTSFKTSKFSKIMPCHRCHMPRIEQDEYRYSWMDHSFFGNQIELPLTIIGPALTDMGEIRRFSSDSLLWMQGKLPVLNTMEGIQDETFKSYRVNNYARTARQIVETRKVASGGNHFTLALESASAKNGSLLLTFSTLNRNTAHDFPTNLFANVTEIWFELDVTDAAGKKIYSSGFSRTDLSHVIGRIEVDPSGAPILPQDSLKYVEIINKKFIRPEQKYIDNYSLPAGMSAKFPLRANYRLMYRRYAEDFVKWFSGGKTPPIPPRVIVSEEFIIPKP